MKEYFKKFSFNNIGKNLFKQNKKIIILIIVGVLMYFTGSNINDIKDILGLDKIVKEQTGINLDEAIDKYTNDNNNESQDANKEGNINENNHKVVKVIDGDTIELENGERVRYIGIDAPERNECFSNEATKKNEELVLGKVVRIEKDKTDKDKYGRLLRYIYVEDIFVNEALARNGFVFTKEYEPDLKNDSILIEAEKHARDNSLGLWSVCPK